MRPGPVSTDPPAVPPPRWAYTYLVVPPQPRAALAGIRTLLARERAAARRRRQTWSARLVVEPLVTGILVVSDSPSRRAPINHRVEQALRALPAGFAVSAPMRIDAAGDDTAPDGRVAEALPPQD